MTATRAALLAHERPVGGYLIMSAKHTRKSDRWITFWRPNNAGYAWRTDWMGLYEESAIVAHPGYYDNRSDTFAVPAAFVLARAVTSSDESGEALRVPNNRRMWEKMVRAAARARCARALAAEAPQ